MTRRSRPLLPHRALLLILAASSPTTSTTARSSPSFASCLPREDRRSLLRRGRPPPSSSCSSRSSSSRRPRFSVRQDDEACVGGERAAAVLFLRFSSLVGGPSFLPLHVEVIVATLDDEDVDATGGVTDEIYVGIDDEFTLAPILSMESVSTVHRFDYLPVDPTNPSTIVRLLTLGGVPGRMRHRERGRRRTDDDDYDGSSNAEMDRGGLSVLVPVGYVPDDDGGRTRTSSDFDVVVVGTAMGYVNDARDDGRYDELRLLGGKNCLSFALDVLSHLKSEVGTTIRWTTPRRMDYWT